MFSDFERYISTEGVSTDIITVPIVPVSAHDSEAGRLTFHITKTFHVVLKRDEEDWVVARCEELPEAISQGKGEEEAKRNIKEAIACILEDEYGGEVPVDEVKVEIRWED